MPLFIWTSNNFFLLHGGMFEEQQCRLRTTKLTQRKDNNKYVFLCACGLFLLFFRVLLFGPFSSFIVFCKMADQGVRLYGFRVKKWYL